MMPENNEPVILQQVQETLDILNKMADSMAPIIEDKRVWLACYTAILNCSAYKGTEQAMAVIADTCLAEYNTRFG